MRDINENTSLFVVKRDGKKVPFGKEFIEKAVNAAEDSVNHLITNLGEVVASRVEEKLQEREEVEINEIQLLVEAELMQLNANVARAYIEYRHDRDVAREKNTKLNSEIVGLIEQSNVELMNENANKDSKRIPTQRDLLAGVLAKHYALNHMLPRDVSLAHSSGDIHYHDLDYAPFFPMFNCMLVDLQGMLTNGFKMGNAEIVTPKSISTATAITAQIIAQVASHIYGGTTINQIDVVLAPYVTASYEKYLEIAKEWNIPEPVAFAKSRTEKECYDAFQSLEYEVNTIHSSNGQTPFVTVSLGLGTSWEERLIQQSVFKNRIAGLGKNAKTAIFPKILFAIKDGINHKKGDPNYDIKQLALECASKRMYPDILNYEQVVKVTGSFKTPMGCRSFLNAYLDENGQEVHEGRNNLGVVSLNLPRVAIEAKGDEAKFFEILDQRIALVRKALDTRIERLKDVKASVAPILYMEGACGVRLNANDTVFDIFKNGRASISMGYIGIHETIIALYGKEQHMFDSEVLREKGIAIIKRLKDAVESWKKETGWGFSLYATPSENLCSRFCALDVKKFGIVEGVNDKEYYTNSFHLDVAKKVNPYDKIDFEMPYPELSSGGFICYGEFPNMQRNLEALENVWDYSYSRVPYYGTNTPIDECYECGYKGEFNATSKGFVCPSCGNHDPEKVSVIRRVCGYLGSPSDTHPFNRGKQIETISRCKHM